MSAADGVFGVPPAPAEDEEMQDAPAGGAPQDATQNPNGHSHTRIQPPPAGKPTTRIPKTPFAGEYESEFTLLPPNLAPEVMKCLGHVNCSYLSTKGRPPTLTELKQHAQSLAVLIKHLTVSTKGGLVDNENYLYRHKVDAEPGDDEETTEKFNKFHQDQSYDWLNNLSEDYKNADHHHNLTLTAVLNRLDDGGDLGSIDICPLHHAVDENPPTGLSLPYVTHQALIKHANEVLELLDHEYSGKGGLLSILPEAKDKEDRKEAETTLLGQLILYIQRLVLRLHDLERLYANSMDVLAGEAVVPHQTLSKLGPKGRQGREVVFPQDRFVLANAGDDVWQFLQREFDRKEIADVLVDKNYRSQGVMGEALWKARGGREHAQGLTTLDVVTRYYRVRNDPLKTVFVIPAHQSHPGVEVTREMEKQATVVSVVKPVWPERQSMWEMRNRENLKRLKELERERLTMTHDNDNLEQEKKILEFDRETKTAEIIKLKEEVKVWRERAENDANRLKLEQVMPSITKAQAAMNENIEQKTKYESIMKEAEKERLLAKQMTTDAEAIAKNLKDAAQKDRDDAQQARLQAREVEEDVARAAQDIAHKLKEAWLKQFKESRVLIEYLTKPEAQKVLAKETPDDKLKEDVEKDLAKLVDDAAKEGERLLAQAAEARAAARGPGRPLGPVPAQRASGAPTT